VIALRFETWEPTYQEILAEFGFDRAADEACADWLAVAIDEPPFHPRRAWKHLGAQISGRPTTVVGAADDAALRLRRTPSSNRLVAADGATTAALEAHRVPDLIVTDLDGAVEDEVRAVEQGAYVAIHAHGDNRAAVSTWLPRFEPSRVLGTCQSRPVRSLQNVGGFTDGDRACHIAHALGASELLLVGFAFEGPVGKYTGRFDPKTKPRKLAWSKRLIDALSTSGATIRYA
jgi:2-amino-4-hydroxy-6-hydroxymethyldihydropteridine diphosphokinase